MSNVDNSGQRALFVLPSLELQADIAFYTRQLGFQLVALFPAEEPCSADLSGPGILLRLDTQYNGHPGCLLIQTSKPLSPALVSPSGTRIE